MYQLRQVGHVKTNRGSVPFPESVSNREIPDNTARCLHRGARVSIPQYITLRHHLQVHSVQYLVEDSDVTVISWLTPNATDCAHR
jgi:hypothetical protein